MKRIPLFVFAFYSLLSFADSVPRLEMELTSEEYQQLLGDQQIRGTLSSAMEAGKRLMDWVNLINQYRTANQKISLSGPETTRAFPPERPIYFSPKLINAKTQKQKSQLPHWMKSILFEGASPTKDLPVADAKFIELAAPVDHNYQNAARWTLLRPYLTQLAKRKADDVRGYYFLSLTKDLKSKWAAWDRLKVKEKKQILEWLKGMCQNGQSERTCHYKVNGAADNGSDLSDLYRQFFPRAKAKWDHFFRMQNLRSDVNWTNPDLMELPFVEPRETKLRSFLKDNIEDEWHWEKWHLKLRFGANYYGTAQLKFKAGVTPHVNGVGGNVIFMDKNAPLSEYAVRWAIRHEFGHVLGFNDCYVEFYDRVNQMMVNYQLDTTDLMCSRKGKLKKSHFDALKKAYYR